MTQIYDFPETLSNVIILDCDDVAVQWFPGLTAFGNEVMNLGLDPAGPDNFGCVGWLPPLPGISFEDIILQFHRSSYFAKLEPVPGAVEAIKLLRETGHEIHFVSSCSTETEIVAGRQRCLESILGLGGFDTLTCVDLGACKQTVLEQFSPGIFIDDRPKNVWAGEAAGHFSFAMHCQTNVFDRGGPASALRWLRDWSDFTSQIPYLPHVLRTQVPAFT